MAGSVYIRNKGKKNQLYCGSVTVATGDRRTVYAKKLTDVRKKMRALEGRSSNGQLEQPNRHTVETYLESWLDNVRRNRRETTEALYRIIVTRHIVPFIGKVKLTALTPARLEDLYARLEREGRSKRMLQHVHLRLHTALKHAKRQNLIQTNPSDNVVPPTAPKRAMTALDADQARTLLAAARGDRLEALFVLAITTGMRQGEILALRWQDVNLDGAVLVVHHTLVPIGSELQLREPKTSASRRRIDLSAGLVNALRAHLERLAAVDAPHADADFVFADAGGKPMRKRNLVRESLEPLLKKAGLPRIRFHDLRHTSASLLLASGVSVKVAQERLGHARASITLDVYAHTVPTMQREAAAFFDTILGPRNPESG